MGSNYLALISNNWRAGLLFSSGDLGLYGSGHQPCKRGDPSPQDLLQVEVGSTRDTPMIQEDWQSSHPPWKASHNKLGAGCRIYKDFLQKTGKSANPERIDLVRSFYPGFLHFSLTIKLFVYMHMSPNICLG